MYFVQKRIQTKSQPQKERRQKDAAAVFREACSIRRSTLVVLIGVLNYLKSYLDVR